MATIHGDDGEFFEAAAAGDEARLSALIDEPVTVRITPREFSAFSGLVASAHESLAVQMLQMLMDDIDNCMRVMRAITTAEEALDNWSAALRLKMCGRDSCEGCAQNHVDHCDGGPATGFSATNSPFEATEASGAEANLDGAFAVANWPTPPDWPRRATQAGATDQPEGEPDEYD